MRAHILIVICSTGHIWLAVMITLSELFQSAVLAANWISIDGRGHGISLLQITIKMWARIHRVLTRLILAIRLVLQAITAIATTRSRCLHPATIHQPATLTVRIIRTRTNRIKRKASRTAMWSEFQVTPPAKVFL